MRKGFSFYNSFYEQIKLLNKTQKCDIFLAICEVQFFEKDINEIAFKNNVTQLVWVGIKHSLQTSIDGYCSKMNINYHDALRKGLDKVLTQKDKDKVKYKYKDNEEAKEKSSSSSTVTQAKVESDSEKIAKYLYDKILTRQKGFRQPNFSAWQKDISNALIDDNRTANELIGCIDWIYSDEGTFWIPVILSPRKLREKYDVMESQMMNNPKNKSKNKIAQALYEGGY